MKQGEYTQQQAPPWPSELDAYSAEQLVASIDDLVAVRIVDEATKIVIGDGIPSEKVKLLIELIGRDSGQSRQTSV